MKNALLGSLIGVAIVFALDMFVRILISLYTDQAMIIFGFQDYPGFMWALLIVLLTFVSTTLGGMFTLSYGKEHLKWSLVIFTTFILLLRYGQVHVLINTETLVYPILALIVSLLGIAAAWKFSTGKKADVSKDKTHHKPSEPTYIEPDQ